MKKFLKVMFWICLTPIAILVSVIYYMVTDNK